MEKGMKVAPWIVKERKTKLFYNLVGFLESSSEGLFRAEQWLRRIWGKMAVKINMLDKDVV